MTNQELKREVLAFAKEIATTAHAAIVAAARDDLQIDRKGRIDLVTNADKAAEDIILSGIRTKFPEHSILSEEDGSSGSEHAAYRWIVDPLDGTTNFAHGFPYWSVSVAWARDDSVEVGVVVDPWGRCFWASKGEGAWCDDRKRGVSGSGTLADSLLVTGFSYTIRTDEETNMDAFSRLAMKTQGVRRTGSAALDLCMVAEGSFDGYWERSLHAWDFAAGILLVPEAGGEVTDCQGRELTLKQGSLLASNGLVHDQIRECL